MTQAMDIQAMQSMDWLFKKERIYLLAQFWQQRATLAEKEVATLKEQLGGPDKGSSSTMPAAVRGQQSGDGAEAANPAGQGESGARPGLEQELVNKEKEISLLSDDISRLQAALGRAQEGSLSQVQRLQEQLEQRTARIARLENLLEAQRDYEEVKRELTILRSMDLPTFAAAAAAAAAGEGQPPGKALELLNEAAAALTRRPASPTLEEPNQQDGARTPNSTSTSTTGATNAASAAAAALFPPSLQTVETFGSFLGEEIVANWRRSLERTILSQNANSLPPPPPSTQEASESAGENASEHPSAPSSPDRDVKPIINHASPPVTPSMQQMLQHQALQQQQLMMMNGGTPKTPAPSHSPASGLNSPNNGPMIQTSTPILHADGSKTSPFRFDERGPFRFENERISLGESLIPKGDPMEARLQEMLRYNMDQYASQNLDTLHIARRVRELLSIHNIGQRLFAKYVLGLSQGTVSELLSKPKPWDKLTEKGRDSYRKMHGWACDENAVMLLKSLIPKKGKEGGGLASSFGGRPGEQDNLTEERIAHILSEASQAMKGAQPPVQGAQGPPNPNVLAAALAAAAAAASQQQQHHNHNQDDSRSNDSRSPASAQEKVARIYQEELAKLMGRRMEDSLRAGGPQQPPPGQQHFQSLLFPHFFGPGGPASAGGGPGQMERTHDEIRLALDAYHRELSKLNHAGIPPGLLAMHHPHMTLNGQAQDLSLPKERCDSERDPDKSSPLHSSNSSHNGMSDNDDKSSVSKEINAATEAAVADAIRQQSGSAFSLVRPKTEPGSQASSVSSPSPLNSILPPAGPGGEDFTVSAASPLQRMASITNSLISTPNTPSHHPSQQRPLKAVLPPITQQQFDQFNNLNTEDIVKKVKEQLSQYSISQRLFGESVLGLSQGSVSDLLARPKPWHMLTQKGREPFIRMKMFLEDENAVHKLVASQYKIAPEKLMRTGGYGSINPPGFEPMNFGIPRDPRDLNNFHPKASMNKPAPSKPKLPDPVVKAMENAAVAAAMASPGLLPGLPPPTSTTPSLPPPLPTPPTPSPGPRHSPPVTPESPSPMLKKQNMVPRSMAAAAAAAMQQQPSVYEMAALTQDLDTQLVTTRIKEALLANNIGQKPPHVWPRGAPPDNAEHDDAVTTMEKIFGEVVLGLSQGSVSELLSKPKPWHMLSIKGREPFIRMQLWLTDPHNVERLQQMKTDRREANKRRRTTTGTGADNSSDTSSNDTSEFYHATSGSPGPPSTKKQRVLFSEEQKEALRLAFALDPYPNMATIEFLANELNLAARTITNWFHNHRMRLKQTVPHGNNNNEPATQSPQQNSSSTFDPSQFRLLLGQRLTEIHKERGGGAMPPFPFFNPTVAMVSPVTSLPNLPPLPPQHLLAAAMREQMSGLDLSMTSIKKENSDSDSDSDDSNLSADFSQRLAPAPAPVRTASRRKPAAPQWVNPEWQEDKEKDDVKSPPAIINGVCVMQTDNFSSRNSEVDDETMLIEPTQPDKEKGKETKEVTPETTIELGVNATTEAEGEVDTEEADDWEEKIIENNEDTDKPVKAGSEEWDF